MSPQQLVSVVQRTAGSTSTRGPPLAVGRLAVDLDTLKADAKGKAVHVLHTWKDHLFDMGNKAGPPGEIEAEEHEGRDEDAPQSEAAGAGKGQESVPDDVATDPNRTNGAASNALPPAESLVPTSVPKVSTSTPSAPVFSKEGEICPLETMPRLNPSRGLRHLARCRPPSYQDHPCLRNFSHAGKHLLLVIHPASPACIR